MNDKSVASVLLLTGSMGAGKTTAMVEASDILIARDIPHAAIDFDALGIVHVASSEASWGHNALAYRNLRSVTDNYLAAGVTKFLIAAAVDRAELEGIRNAMNPTHIVVCRLLAPMAVMQERVRRRDFGMLQQKFVARVSELEALLDAEALEDFTVLNDGRNITEVAAEVLSRAGWLSAS